MRTAIHIALILVCGVAIGLVARKIRHRVAQSQPSANDVVYTSDIAPGEKVDEGVASVADEATRPPEDADWMSRFELTERSGESVTSESLLGEPYVVSFFFSTCPSICIQQNQKIQELQTEFSGEGVRFVAISVDPETDSPEVLREYAARFGADANQWLFLTGDLTYIRRVGAEVFQLPVDQKFHSERFVLVDVQGKIAGFYNWPEKKQFEQLKNDIRKIIHEHSTEES